MYLHKNSNTTTHKSFNITNNSFLPNNFYTHSKSLLPIANKDNLSKHCYIRSFKKL